MKLIEEIKILIKQKKEVGDIMSRVIETRISIGGVLDPSVQKAFGKIGEYSSKISSKLLAVGKAAAAGATAIGGVAGISAAAFQDYDQASRQLLASTGAVGEKAEILKDTLKDVYADNFGESWDDVASAVSTVNKLIGGTQEEIKKSTENAFTFKDTFGAEIQESIRASKTLMDQFGLSNAQAFNLMSQGEQHGLDYSGELLDSINEYSVQFKKFGFNAEDMFNIFNDGAIDGAFNLDKIGDAVKEFGVRAIDGSSTTIDGFTKLGMSADEMAKKFASGGDDSKEAFYQVTQAIANMNDPVQQSIVGVDLFGTMWEDLGPKVMTQIGNIGDEFNANLDTMNEINNIKYTGFSSALTGIKRQIEAAIIPLGEALIPYMNTFANWFNDVGVPKVKQFADFIGTSLPGAIKTIKDNIEGFLPVIVSLASAFAAFMIINKVIVVMSALSKAFAVIKTIGFAISAFAGGAATLGEAMAFIMGPVGWITLAIIGLVAGVVLLYQKCQPFREFVNQLFSQIVTWVQGSLLPAISNLGQKFLNLWNTVLVPFGQWIGGILAPIFQIAFVLIGSYISTVFSAIGGYIDGMLTAFGGIIDFITGIFTGNWSLAWQGVVEIFSGIMGGLKSVMKSPLNGVISLINSAIGGINGISIDIPDWVPQYGGQSFSTNIPTIPMLAKGGFTNIPSICGEAGPEAVIPLKRNNPRSISLLEKTAATIGMDGNKKNSSPTFVFSPQISGSADSDTLNKLKQSFEDFKSMVLEVLDDEERVDFG
jgi:phage-related minor tail protein